MPDQTFSQDITLWIVQTVQMIYYQPEGVWFGDCMPFAWDGQFFLFHQRDTRNPGPFGEPFGWALARTRDFVEFEDLGDAIPRGGDEEQDQFIFAGSVFEARGTFYAMYTGYNRDFPAQGRPAQVMMVATSTDLIHWTKTGRTIAAPESGYDPDDWRDPFVLWDDSTERFIMILGGRKTDGERLLTGRTVWFTSPDLVEWEFQGDFWAPGLYLMHEMPDLFRLGDYWYLLTTEYSDKSKTVYRMSTSLNGPWLALPDDAFDGRAYYAARSAAVGDKRYLFGWVPTKENDNDLGAWQWGGTLVVHEVFARHDGSLGVRAPETVAGAFGEAEDLGAHRLGAEDAPAETTLGETTLGETTLGETTLGETTLTETSGDLFRLDVRVRFAAGVRSFSIRLGENSATGEAYEFLFDLVAGRLSFDRRPNYPWNRYDSKGLERPIRLEADREYGIRLIVDGTIATIYVDGVALNARMYAKAGDAVAMQVIGGELDIPSLSIARGLGLSD